MGEQAASRVKLIEEISKLLDIGFDAEAPDLAEAFEKAIAPRQLATLIRDPEMFRLSFAQMESDC